MAADENDSPNDAGAPQNARPEGTPSLQDIIANQKLKLQEKLEERARAGGDAEEEGQPQGGEEKAPAPDSTEEGAAEKPAPPPATGEPDSPEVAQARLDAVMAARTRGASREEAQKAGEEAAAAARARLPAGGGKPAPGEDGEDGEDAEDEGIPPARLIAEHPDIAAAWKEAYENAIARGADEDEARLDAEAAAEMVRADLASDEAQADEDESEGQADHAEGDQAATATPKAAAKPQKAEAPSAHSLAGGRPVFLQPPARRFSLLQIVLLMNTGLIVMVVGSMLGLLPFRSGSPGSPAPAPAAGAQAERPAAQSLEEPTGDVEVRQALSGERAERALAKERYEEALERYRRLLASTKSTRQDELVGDFFRLRIAECLSRMRRWKDARSMYGRVGESSSPIVSAVANYHTASMDAADGQYLLARMRAYRAIAALNALKHPSPLEADCDFLIARVLTQKVKTYHQCEDFIPWPVEEQTDPFRGLGERELSALLRDGAAKPSLSVAMDQVRVEPGKPEGTAARWAVECFRAPVEQVLHRFASADGSDVKWESVNPAARLRTVSLRVQAMSSRRVNEVVSGMAGLIARFTLDTTVLHDPHAYTTMSQQRDLLRREADSVWRGFFLRWPTDTRTACGRFAVAALAELSGDAAGALREYQLVSRRFRLTQAAQRALVRSARIRCDKLRDYLGARKDLIDLLNLWPDCEKSAEVNLTLGRACLEAGLIEKAETVFRKLYHLNLSAESRRQACLGVGECFYRKGEFGEAGEWLERYVRLPNRPSPDGLSRGYLMLGRSRAALEKWPAAVAAYRRALAWSPTEREFVAASLGLVRVHLQTKDFVSAVGALGALKKKRLRTGEMRDYLILASRTYRGMGLASRGQTVLSGGLRSPLMADPAVRAQVLVELARCYAAEDDLSAARATLLEAIPRLAAGSESWAARLELADVCLRMGKAEEAAALARELLASRCSEALRARAREIAVSAHVRRQDYEGAARALSQSAGGKKGAGS